MRREKQYLLDEVKEHIEDKGSFIITQYSGISANKMCAFRDDIAKIGGDIHMVRKRILVKAAAAAGVELNLSDLKGHIGLVFAGNDAIETTKAVFQFGKDSEDALRVLAGQIDGQLYNATDIERLSKLPGINEMRAQLLGLFKQPMGQLVGVCNAAVTSVLYCLEAKKNKDS